MGVSPSICFSNTSVHIHTRVYCLLCRDKGHEHCQEFGSLLGKRLPWKGILPTSQKPFPQTIKSLIPNSIHWQKDKLHGVGSLETLGTGTTCLILPFVERLYVITFHIPSSPYYSKVIHTKCNLHTNITIDNSKKEEEIKTKFSNIGNHQLQFLSVWIPLQRQQWRLWEYHKVFQKKILDITRSNTQECPTYSPSYSRVWEPSVLSRSTVSFGSETPHGWGRV